MGDYDSALPNNDKNPITWILWGALFFSIAVYAGVGTFISTQDGIAPADPEITSLLIPIFAMISLMETVLVLFFVGKLFRIKDYQTYCILRWALSESIAIYGLVLMFLGAMYMAALAFMIWAAVLYILTMPTRASKEKFNAELKRIDGSTIG